MASCHADDMTCIHLFNKPYIINFNLLLMGIALAVLGLICVIVPFGGVIVKLLGSALMIVGCNQLGYDWNVALVVAGLGTTSSAFIMNKFTDNWELADWTAIILGIIEVIAGFFIGL